MIREGKRLEAENVNVCKVRSVHRERIPIKSHSTERQREKERIPRVGDTKQKKRKTAGRKLHTLFYSLTSATGKEMNAVGEKRSDKRKKI